MFTKFDPKGFVALLPGISVKVVGHGTHTLTVVFLLEANRSLPIHSHIFEQTGTLLEGEMMLTIGEKTYHVHPGDAWTIPPNVPHGAEIVSDSRVMEIFSPPREDYLKIAKT